jgi:hypothetical protein
MKTSVSSNDCPNTSDLNSGDERLKFQPKHVGLMEVFHGLLSLFRQMLGQ